MTRVIFPQYSEQCNCQMCKAIKRAIKASKQDRYPARIEENQ